MRFGRLNNEPVFAKPGDEGGGKPEEERSESIGVPERRFNLSDEKLNKLPEEVRPIAQFMAGEIDARVSVLFDLIPEILDQADQFEALTAELVVWADALRDLTQGKYNSGIGALEGAKKLSEAVEDFSASERRKAGRGLDAESQYSENAQEADLIESFLMTLRTLSKGK